MDPNELEFLEERLAATELLPCAECGEETLHAHLEVLEAYAYGSELLMQCTECGATRTWVDTGEK